jgi:hypothetical protein
MVLFLYTRKEYQQLREQRFVSGGILYIVLRNYWYDIVVLNAQTPAEDKRCETKGGFYGELELVFYQSLKYHST